MRARTKTLGPEALLVLLISCTLFSGCSVEKPSPPSWDSQWRLPLVNKSYSVLDLIEEIDQEGLSYDSLGNPEIYVQQEIDTVTVGNNLTFQGYSDRLVETLGSIDIESPGPELVTVDLGDLNPVWSGPTVLPFHFSISEPMAQFDEFTYVTVEAGMIYVSVHNSLGLELDTLTLELVDDYNSQVVGTIEVEGGLPNGQTYDDSLSLAGRTVHNQFSLVLEGHSPGGELGPGDQTLQTTVSFSEHLTVSQAEAKIPAFAKRLSQEVTSDDSSVIAGATVNSGQLWLQIENHTNLEAQLYISSPNILYEGDSLLLSRLLYAGERADTYRSLEGHELQPQGNDIPQSITVNLLAEAPGSGEELRLFDQNDSITATLEISDVVFSEVTGRVKPTSVEFEPQEKNLDLPEGLEEMHLADAKLSLTFYNSADFPADLDLVISGDNGRQLNLTGRIEAEITPQVPRKTVITKEKEELSDFLNPFPEGITVQGEALLNPDYQEGHISEEDIIYGEIEICSPLSFAILDTATLELEIEEVDGEWEDADRLKSGEVTAEIENHLPVGAQVTIYIGEVGDNRIYTHPGTAVVGPLSLSAAPVSQLGLTTASTQNSFQESLSLQQLEVFDHDVVYVAKRIVLFPTEGEEAVSVRSDDYLRVLAAAELIVELGGED